MALRLPRNSFGTTGAAVACVGSAVVEVGGEAAESRVVESGDDALGAFRSGSKGVFVAVAARSPSAPGRAWLPSLRSCATAELSLL
jgi:hypothetical protein